MSLCFTNDFSDGLFSMSVGIRNFWIRIGFSQFICLRAFETCDMFWVYWPRFCGDWSSFCDSRLKLHWRSTYASTERLDTGFNLLKNESSAAFLSVSKASSFLESLLRMAPMRSSLSFPLGAMEWGGTFIACPCPFA